MILSRLHIKNFRRLKDAAISLDRASFLIGQNNYGKSSVLAAVDCLLSQELPTPADFRVEDSGAQADEISIQGTFTGIGNEVATSRGFKGRVVDGAFQYRKVYKLKGGKTQLDRVECVEYPWSIMPAFAQVKTVGELIEAGFPADQASLLFGDDPTKSLRKGWQQDVLDVVAAYDTIAQPTWVANPGGIQGNVLSRLPRLLHIPPLTAHGEVGDANKQTLISRVLSIIFEDVIAASPLAETLRSGLRELETAMSPQSEGSLLRTLCTDVNTIIGGVFPGCGMDIKPSLDDLSAILKPKYEVALFSNTSTGVDRQGTGLLRTTVFSMLRYHSQLRARKESATRPLLIAFEEPELYLHPAAANLLRDTIYELGSTDQILCTTHSPWMIDLSRPWQSLSKMTLAADGSISVMNYGVAEKLDGLPDPDKGRVKMLQSFDDELSRVFFAERIVVVEGDTEEIVFKASLRCLSDVERRQAQSRVQLVKARGKAAIISLVKYLKALGIQPFVIHDRDGHKEGAMVFNAPIAEAVGDPSAVRALVECMEDALGYPPPSSDKPYKAYLRSSEWTTRDHLPAEWRKVFDDAIAPPVVPGVGAYSVTEQTVTEVVATPAV